MYSTFHLTAQTLQLSVCWTAPQVHMQAELVELGAHTLTHVASWSTDINAAQDLCTTLSSLQAADSGNLPLSPRSMQSKSPARPVLIMLREPSQSDARSHQHWHVLIAIGIAIACACSSSA